jgi:hypothetical protein
MSPEEDFLRYTQESVFSWYRQADDKARIILGFTGVFLSILVGALIAEYAESGGSNTRLHGVGLLLFVVAVACHVGAVLFSTAALWSRGVFAPRKAGIAFFGDIANFDSAADFEHAVRAEVSEGLYVDDLARNILVLCKNTRLKHRLVDAAAVSSGLALLATMCLVVILLIDSTRL